MILVVCKRYNDMIMAKLGKKTTKNEKKEIKKLLKFWKGTKMSY